MHSVFTSLKEQGFQCDESLDHEELIPFVREYLFKKNNVTLGYLFINVFFLFILIVSFINSTQAFLWLAAGLVGTFLLVPVHEFLHGIAYWACGAKKVSYKANWKKLYFMAVADKFITKRVAFFIIALTPFTFISISLMILAFYIAPDFKVMWLTTLFIHATMCAGDFGLMSYFEENRDREVVTFDDDENGMSYFYSRNSNNDTAG